MAERHSMSLAHIFEDTIENMEEENLHSLIIGLCESGSERSIAGSADERKFLKIIALLLGFAGYSIRASVGEHVREMKGLPGELYLYFACDDIKIARLFLQPEFPLSNDDMMHIVKNTTTEHRLALVEREDLPPEVVQEIMRLNEVHVVRAMNQNETAAIFYEYDDSFGDDSGMGIGADIGDFQQNVSAKENPLDVMTKLFSEKSRFVDMIELLAKSGKLPKGTVKDLFGKKDVEPISILCKGLGMSEEAFAALAKFRCRRLGQLERLAENAVLAYPEIEEEYAKAMLVDLQGQAARMVKAIAAI